MLGSGLSAVEGVPVQMRRPMPGEFTGIRPLPTPNTHPHMMPGLMRHLLHSVVVFVHHVF